MLTETSNLEDLNNLRRTQSMQPNAKQTKNVTRSDNPGEFLQILIPNPKSPSKSRPENIPINHSKKVRKERFSSNSPFTRSMSSSIGDDYMSTLPIARHYAQNNFSPNLRAVAIASRERINSLKSSPAKYSHLWSITNELPTLSEAENANPIRESDEEWDGDWETDHLISDAKSVASAKSVYNDKSHKGNTKHYQTFNP